MAPSSSCFSVLTLPALQSNHESLHAVPSQSPALSLATMVPPTLLALDGEGDFSSQEAWCPHRAYLHCRRNSIRFKCIYIYLAPMCQLQIFWKESFLSIVIFSQYITGYGSGSSTLLHIFEECIGPWSHIPRETATRTGERRRLPLE